MHLTIENIYNNIDPFSGTNYNSIGQNRRNWQRVCELGLRKGIEKLGNLGG